MKNMKKLSQVRTKAFTLVEMLIVIIIIGILLAVVGPKAKAMIDNAKLSSAMSSTDAISKSVEQFNTTSLGEDSGLTLDSDALQKFPAQMAFRKVADDSFVTGTYVGDSALAITQNGTALPDVLKSTYGLTPAEFKVDSAPTVGTYWNKKYYILTDVDTTNGVIKWQVLLYCIKTNSFKWNANYEAMWSAETAKTEDANWMSTLKSNAEDAGYNCIVKAIPYTN